MSSSTMLASLRSRLIGTGTPAERVKAILSAILGPSDRSLLPFIPRPIKLLAALIFILNWRSWPFIWHVKVFRAVLKLRLDALLNARTVPDRRRWLGRISCVGGDPFELVSTQQHYCGLDDTDYNGHLSNSSYAKACDAARMKAACEVFPACFGDGSWLALGGSSYSFIREIPYGVNYEIKTSIGGWDNKWMYLVHHFVTYPTNKKHTKPQTKAPNNKLSGQGNDSHTAGFPHMMTPSTPSLTATPARAASPRISTPQATTPYKAPSTIPKYKLKTRMPEGALIHCVAISTYCFKAGRITVPPAVAFIAGGLGDPSKQRWFHVQDLRFNDRYPPASNKRVLKNKMTEILRGGWKTDIVEGWESNADGVSSFWELGEYEERRDENMKAIFGGVQLGMKNLRDREDWFPL